MLKIRLRRTGAKKQPSYRVVVAESTAPRDGTFVEILGHYNPITRPTTFAVDLDRARHWIARGAQPSERVARLLVSHGVSEAAVSLPASATRQQADGGSPAAAGATVREAGGAGA